MLNFVQGYLLEQHYGEEEELQARQQAKNQIMYAMSEEYSENEISEGVVTEVDGEQVISYPNLMPPADV